MADIRRVTANSFARAGWRVAVHESHPAVGYRFSRDLQGLENWTREEDVLDMLHRIGITTDFVMLPCRAGTAFDARVQSYALRSHTLLFYMVERGQGEVHCRTGRAYVGLLYVPICNFLHRK